MVTIHRIPDSDERLVAAKGATEAVIEAATRVATRRETSS